MAVRYKTEILIRTGGQFFDVLAEKTVAQSSVLTEEDIRRWFSPLIHALQALHGASLQHRDIKPEVCDDQA